MSRIHALACVDPAARIADDAEIGPYCVVGPDVAVGSGCRLIAHVHVEGHTELGAGTVVYPHASLGTAPQSVAYNGEPTRLTIGVGCQIREGVTMNIGTAGGGGVTRVGDRGFFMANAHVGHDCRVGDDVVFANCATLGGHCEIGHHVFIGGLSAVHQFTRIGDYAMIGGVSGIRGDVIPYGMASGEHARMIGINTIGMKRRSFAHETIMSVRKAYKILFFGLGRIDERLDSAEAEYGDDVAVSSILQFIRTRGNRALCWPEGKTSG